MSQYIEKNKLLRDFDSAHIETVEGARNLIAIAKEVDASLTKTGQWTLYGQDESGKCSYCGDVSQHVFQKTPSNRMLYCPRCGADMTRYVPIYVGFCDHSGGRKKNDV